MKASCSGCPMLTVQEICSHLMKCFKEDFMTKLFMDNILCFVSCKAHLSNINFLEIFWWVVALLNFVMSTFLVSYLQSFHYSLLKNSQILSGIAYRALLIGKKCVYSIVQVTISSKTQKFLFKLFHRNFFQEICSRAWGQNRIIFITW